MWLVWAGLLSECCGAECLPSRDPFMSGLDNCMLARNLSSFPTRLRSIYLSLGKLLGQVRRVLYFCYFCYIGITENPERAKPEIYSHAIGLGVMKLLSRTKYRR